MGFSVPGQNTQNTAPRSAPVATSRAGNYATTMTRQQDAALAPAMPSEPVKYEADGQEIELSPELIKSYLVSGDADKVNDQEVMMFLNLCRYNHLNPWLKEAYLIKYGDKPATMVPGQGIFYEAGRAQPALLQALKAASSSTTPTITKSSTARAARSMKILVKS